MIVENSVRAMPWYFRDVDEGEVFKLASEHQIDEVIARILVARHVDGGDVGNYLDPTLKTMMPDPYVMLDMEKAATRLAAAIMAGQNVGIFGDYDVDGVTATSLLYLYLKELKQDPEIYLPDRVVDGYGPSIEAFRSLKERGVDIIVTVDCGASAHDPIEAAGREGIEILVMDHHQMSAPPPAHAHAVVNPNRPDDLSGLTNLSAVGVTFMLLVAVNRILREDGFFSSASSSGLSSIPQPDLRKWLDIVALGLVCDVMSVKGLTRAMIAQGLKILTHQLKTGEGGNAGLSALAKRSGAKGTLTPYHLGFLIGPRINAAGRIGHANMAFDVITTPDRQHRTMMVEKLHVMNAERREIETGVLEAAVRQVEQLKTLPDVLVCSGDGWHPGVIGIVAGRIKERFDRPAFVIGFEGDVGKGSGRSIDGVDLGGGVSAARQEGLLVAGGGHAMAAGLTIAREHLNGFQDFMSRRLADDIHSALAARFLKIDGEIVPGAVTAEFAHLIGKAGPFGAGNSEPYFVIRNVRAVYPKIVGDAHLSCVLRSDGGEETRAIAFRCLEDGVGDALKSGDRLHVAGRIKVDDWRGGNAGQFQINDVAYVKA